MEKAILIILLVCCNVTLAADCPEQRWEDATNWYFEPDPNFVIGYLGVCHKIEQGQRYGFYPTVCDKDSPVLNVTYSQLPPGAFVDPNSWAVWTPAELGNYYLTADVNDHAMIPRLVSFTYGIQVIPRDVPPVVEPELNIVPF